MRPPKKNTSILLIIFSLLLIQSTLAALDPDVYRTFQEIVISKGYPCQNYTVQTSDGYLLGLFRIVKNDNQPHPPVLLMHGLLDSSFTWIVNYPHQSLAYILADNGFDVWMGNVRGNTYSRAHVKLNPNDKEFWQFSWDEFAAIDVPEIIDFVLKETNRQKLSYIGHSQGTMQMFSGLSVNPSLANKLNVFIGLGPVITITHMTNPFIPIAASLNLDEFLYFFGFKEFLPTVSGIAAILGEWFCHYQPDYCANIIELICGPHKGSFNISRMEVIVSHEPGGTSVMNLWHWGQLYRSRTWQMFDYGSDKENKLHYNQTKPPAYSLNGINKNLPIALFYGENDELADPTDVKNLIKALPYPPVFVKSIKEYAHLDFAWALDAPTVMYADIITLLKKYN